jgi:NitT/TauT family transport system permease protein/sulfonate transport system permease protein
VSRVAAAADATPARARGLARVRTGALTTHLLSLLVLLLWMAVSYVLPDYLMPSPWVVARQVARQLTTPAFLVHAGLSVWHITASIAVAMVMGMALALLSHFVPATRLAINGRLNPFLSSFSTVGWIFLSIIWFGVNEVTVIFVVAATLLPFSLSNLRAGLQELDRETIEMSRSFSRSRLKVVAMVLAPLMVPYIFATLRICLGVAWKVVLTAELFGGTSGLGYLIARARADFDTVAIFAMIVIIVMFVYLSDKFLIEPIQLRLRRNYAIS